MNDQLDESGLREASRRFYEALDALLEGDPAAMFELWSHADDVSYLGPMGGLLIGWEPIRASWQAQAAAGLAGHVKAERQHFVVGANVGVVVGYERGTVRMGEDDSIVNIRATSTYRVEDGSIKMIGHHTDLL